jgi:hypothetical protein
MFQLIVAVISIALVAALAIASIFYGGEAFTKSSEKANVTALVNQAQQISGAYQLFKTDAGAAPATIAELSPSYLASLPTPPKVATAAAAWDFATVGTGPTARQVVEIELKGLSADVATDSVCLEVARQAGGTGANAQFTCEAGGTNLKFSFKL